MLFDDRREAGQLLARELEPYRQDDAIVLGLPRGGVVIGREIAVLLRLPLDVFIAMKVGAPGRSEYAIGAVAETGDECFNEPEIEQLGIARQYLADEAGRQREEIARRIDRYREGRPLPSLRGRRVFLVDDGIATGLTVRAAIQGIRRHGAESLILAVPVAPAETIEQLEALVDRTICLATPEPFPAVGAFYENFSALDDHDVLWCLENVEEPAWLGASSGFFYDDE